MRVTFFLQILYGIFVLNTKKYGAIAYSQYSDSIPIGLLTDRNEMEMKTVFNRAISVANSGLEIPLRGVSTRVTYGNSFEAYKKLCNMLSNGVGAVFGPSSRSSAAHVMNICDAKEIPHIDSRIDYEVRRGVVNLHPHPKDIARAIYDIIDSFAWPSFTFLYESGDYLYIFNELMELYRNGGPLVTVRRYDLQLNGNYRSVLRRIRKSQDSAIVIVGSTETLPELLRQAQQVGIIVEDYKYIIGNLDFHTLDLEPYKHSEANITGIRMFSPEDEQVANLATELNAYAENQYDGELIKNVSCPITMEMALLYDGVQLMAETTKTLKFRPVPLNCSAESVWERGSTFRNYLALTSANGLTGKIYFENDIRTHYQFDLIELTASGLAKVGTWNSTSGLSIHRYTPTNIISEGEDELSLVNKTFTVLLALMAPHGMLKKSTTKLSGNNRYEGFGVEMIQRLAEKLGFNYTFKMHVDDNYGFFNVSSNKSNGMIHEIMEGRADLGVTDLTITSEREAGVDFTIPFMNLGISILYRKPQKEPPKLFSFMDPFSGEVWLFLGLSYIAVSLSFFILGRLSPAEWDNPYPCIEEPTELENQFTFSNSLWITIGVLLQQGSEIGPKAPSTRTVGSIWSFFTLIIVSSYTANLAAFLTVESLSSPINNVEDLSLNKGGVQYGAKSKGSTRNFFQTSEDDTYKLMNDYMTNHPEMLTSTNDEGVKRVLTENYAFLMESTSIEYNVARICNLTQVGGLLDEKGYGIAMRKNWPYRDKLNQALLELQESGMLSKMKSKWWNEVGTSGCTTKNEQTEAEELGMPNLGGVYFVLLCGSLLAAAYGIIEWIVLVYYKARKHHVSFKDELKKEFNIVTDFSNFTRSVKGADSTYSRNSSMTVESIDAETALDD